MNEVESDFRIAAQIPWFQESYYRLYFGPPTLPTVALQWWGDNNESGTPITGNPIQEYVKWKAIEPIFFAQPNLSSLRIIELAPGLAEFLPKVSKITTVAPVGVDVINYKDIELFLTSHLSDCESSQKRTLEFMIEQAKKYQNQIHNICCPLEHLIDEYPELGGQFDMVVFMEATTKRTNAIGRELKQWLLKPKLHQNLQ